MGRPKPIAEQLQRPFLNQIRSLLDPVPPSSVFPLFSYAVDELDQLNYLAGSLPLDQRGSVDRHGWGLSTSPRPTSTVVNAASRTIETCEVKRRLGKHRYTDNYRFVNQVPLRDGDGALEVNWCELTSTRSDGKIVYQNAFATNHRITDANVADIVHDGRARWKVENENNNTLKTKSYHLTHNFGHGHHYLSALLVTCNLLAFLFHTVLELMDSNYQRIREFLPRKRFFNDLRALTCYLCFDSWEALMNFMINGFELEAPDTG